MSPLNERVVALGGGTGLPTVLCGMKDVLFPPAWRRMPLRGRDRLAAIVTVADDGGSSGRLRRAFGVLAPGDVRNCLLALAEGDGPWHALFRFRFDGEKDVGGHSLGNLILTALSQVEGDFPRAIERVGEALSVRGRVLPSTMADVTLVAELEDGSCARGESEIGKARTRVRRLRLEPETAASLPRALDALQRADLIVLGPGSLYTSLLPNLLVAGIVDAIRASSARVVMVMNLMTQPGETDGYTAADHLRVLRGHVPALPVHDVLVNGAPVEGHLLRRYAAEAAELVPCDAAALRELGCRVVERELLAHDGAKLRHDPRRLAEALIEIARSGAGAAPIAASA